MFLTTKMDLSLFSDQIVNIRLKNQNVYEGVKLTYIQNAGYTLRPLTYVYSSNGTNLSASDTRLDIEEIQLTNLDLDDYVGQDVEITLRNWDKHQCVLRKDPSSQYPFLSNEADLTWTKEGKWFEECYNLTDIIHIKFSKPQPAVMNRAELLSTIAETKKQLTLIEEQLAQSQPTLQDAVVGDVLADGSEVLKKWAAPRVALLGAPDEFNQYTADHPNFETYLSNLGTKLNRWDWFVPTAELLELAFGRLDRGTFNKVQHWTSSKERWLPEGTKVNEVARIRAFRYVTY